MLVVQKDPGRRSGYTVRWLLSLLKAQIAPAALAELRGGDQREHAGKLLAELVRA